MAKRIKKSKLIFLIAIGLFFILTIQLICFFTAKPNIKVNYVAEYNKLTKPADYDPSRNAYFDYEKAGQYCVDYPGRLWELSSQWPGDLDDVELDSVKKWISDNNESLEFFEDASSKPYCWRQAPEEDWNTSNILFPHISVMRSLTIALSWRAKLHSMEEDYEQSFRDILISYRVSNQLSGPAKTLIEQLVAASLKSASIESCFEILSNKQIDADRLKKFQMQLEEVISESNSRMYLDVEGLGIKDMIQRVFSDNGKGNGHLVPREYRRLWYVNMGGLWSASTRPHKSFFYRISDWDSVKNELKNILGDFTKHSSLYWYALAGPDRKQTTQKLDEVINYINKLQDKSPWQIHKEGIEPRRQLENELAGFLVFYGWKGFYRMQVILQRAKTCESALLATVAAMRYKAEKGFYPESLSELVDSNYLSELPMDPFNDGPLTYRRTDDSFTLYSFGPDFDDDGGEILRDYDGRISWWEKEGDTVFWPRPRETEEEKQKRLEEQNIGLEQRMNEMIIRLRSDEDTNDFNDIIIDSNNEN